MKKQQPPIWLTIIVIIGMLYLFRGCLGCNTDEVADKKSCSIEINLSQTLVAENKSIKYFDVVGFNPKNIDCWMYLQEFSRLQKTDALNCEYRFYTLPVKGNNTDTIYKKYHQFQIAKSENILSESAHIFRFEPNPMALEKFDYPKEWNSKIQILVENIK